MRRTRYWILQRNYVFDPEEIMAVNFSNALIYGRDGVEDAPYKSPEIIDQILDYLEK